MPVIAHMKGLCSLKSWEGWAADTTGRSRRKSTENVNSLKDIIKHLSDWKRDCILVTLVIGHWCMAIPNF